MFRQVLAFVRSPAPPEYSAQGRGARARLFAIVFALDVAIAALLICCQLLAEGLGADLPEIEKLDMSPVAFAFAAVVVMPVLEEIVFRGWLSGRKPDLEFAGGAAVLFLIVSLIGALGLVSDEGLAALALGGLFLLWLRWLTRRRDTSQVPDWFARHYGRIVYASALIFGSVHLTNFDGFHPVNLLMVVPQTVGGLLLAFTRTRLGLGAAMVQHALFNALFLSVDPYI